MGLDDEGSESEPEPNEPSLLALCNFPQEPEAEEGSEPEVEEVSQSKRKGRGRAAVCGIACDKRGCSYRASVSIGMFTMRARCVADLTVAVDFLAIMTVMKQRALQGAEAGVPFEERITRAYEETLCPRVSQGLTGG